MESVRTDFSNLCSSQQVFFYIYVFFRNKVPSVLLLGLTPELCLWLLCCTSSHSRQSVGASKKFLRGKLQWSLQHLLLFSWIPVKSLLHYLRREADLLFGNVSCLIGGISGIFLCHSQLTVAVAAFSTLPAVVCVGSQGTSPRTYVFGKDSPLGLPADLILHSRRSRSPSPSYHTAPWASFRCLRPSSALPRRTALQNLLGDEDLLYL